MKRVATSERLLLDAKKQEAATLLQAKRFSDALAILTWVCQHDPDDYESWFNLGALNGKLGMFAAAEATFLKALALRSSDPQIYINLARLCDLQGRFDDELVYCRRFLQLVPNDGAAYSQIGKVLHRLGRLPEAEQALREAWRYAPNNAAYVNNLGIVQDDLGRYDDALECYRSALHLNPQMDSAYCNLGKLFQKNGESESSEAAYLAALKINPQNSDVQQNLGILLLGLGRNDEAMHCFNERLRALPECAEAHWNRALLLLAAGNFSDGWEEYEWRFKCHELMSQPLEARYSSKTLWDGSVLTDQTLLIYVEQGFGDTLQFCRYLPLVMQQVKHLIFECQPELFALLSNVFKDIKCIQRPAESALPDIDYDLQAPLLTLPRLLNTVMESIPVAIPYIHADPRLVERWSQRIGKNSFNVGVVWAGNQNYKGDKERSLSLAAIERLGEVSRHICFYSLQKEGGTEAIYSINPMRLVDLASELDSFATTAAVIENLDLVITVDTAVAHLAGAMGKPVWTLIYSPPDWRWLLDRNDSPWYPTMRLFRQSKAGEWDEVIDRVASALAMDVSRR